MEENIPNNTIEIIGIGPEKDSPDPLFYGRPKGSDNNEDSQGAG